MDREQPGLRTGYLLIQTPKKKWKARWFVLCEEELCCYHKHRKSVLISSLPLAGFAITSPCNDLADTNTQGLFKLSTSDGEEMYFQSAGPEDRDGWAHAIGAVIRSLSSTTQISQEKMPFQDFRAYANVSEIIGALQDPDAGIAAATHLRSGEIYKNCFKGSEIVDWLLRWSLVRNRENGSAMAQTLLKLGHLQQVCLKDGSAVSPKFSDADKLYRFTSVNLGATRNSFYDSTDSDSSSSDEDDDDAADDTKPKKGRLLKQSFLAKKKVLRKGWRVVKVKLHETPKSLQYFRASYASNADDKYPSKMVPLEGTIVTEAVKMSSKGSAGASSKSPSYRLCVRTPKGKTMTLQMKDEQEKLEWLSLLQQKEESGASVSTT
ncbi:pleckstrin-like isoform X2 [Littorina saxatilis]|uniref:Pleckstrin n=1 Tax=Littorina saxatilis TaxID=31220 RepID=A0AAN9BAW7_9CAEN